MKILYIVNTPEFFISHRLSVAQAAMKNGYLVHVATGFGEGIDLIRDNGFVYDYLPLSRSGLNIFKEMKVLYKIYLLFLKIKPDVVHLVTIKPVIYGALMARIVFVPLICAAVSGLGTVFSSKGFFLIRLIVKVLYRLSLRQSNVKVIFQNDDDRVALINMGAINPDQSVIIRGSGVDINKYITLREPEGVPVVTFASRLLRDKGIYEFIDAVKELRIRGLNFRVKIIGDVDIGNPTSVSKTEVDAWRADADLELLGHRADIAFLFSQSHIIVLPSYREGLPKVLLEAAACARPVVTTDVPGCRDAILPGKTGILVPARSVILLADAIQMLIENPLLRMQMGADARDFVAAEFRIEKIIAEHLDLYSIINSDISYDN